MAENVQVPGFGGVSKRTLLIAGVGVVVVGGIFLLRNRKASQAAAGAASTTGQTDPAGNVGQIDPQTGYVYGSAEDQQALAALQAYGTPYNNTGGGGLNGSYYGTGGSTSTTPPGPGNFADNAEWAQYAESYMIQTLNGDPNTIGAALGKYLTGQPVSSAQQGLIEEAIAVAGYPPTAGPKGDPPGINLQSGGGGGGGGGTKVTVPNVVGETVGAAHNAMVHAGLKPSGERFNTRLHVIAQAPKAGAKVAKGTTFHLTPGKT